MLCEWLQKTLQEILTNFMVVTMGTSERSADDPTSEDHEVLVEYMVALRYRVYELQSVFVQGKEVWPLTPIHDPKAKDYWESHYENAHCVDWDEFYHDWKDHFKDQIGDETWELPLHNDMDSCHDTSISRYGWQPCSTRTHASLPELFPRGARCAQFAAAADKTGRLVLNSCSQVGVQPFCRAVQALYCHHDHMARHNEPLRQPASG